jgi:hypothetical protein
VYIEQDGKLVAHTYYDDNGLANAATVWRYLATPPIMVGEDITEIEPEGPALEAKLTGELVIRFQHVDRVIAEARMSTLTLQRNTHCRTTSLEEAELTSKRQLTWVKGTGGRAGRWRKKYRGEIYYFPGGRGSPDKDAYDAALQAWHEKRQELERVGARAQYEAAIEEWNEVLGWCQLHGADAPMAAKAAECIARLRSELTRRSPRPLPQANTFAGHFAETNQELSLTQMADRAIVLAVADKISSLGHSVSKQDCHSRQSDRA